MQAQPCSLIETRSGVERKWAKKESGGRDYGVSIAKGLLEGGAGGVKLESETKG